MPNIFDSPSGSSSGSPASGNIFDSPSTAPKSSSGIGGFLHKLGKVTGISPVAHVVEKTGVGLAKDLAGLPGGIYQMGKTEYGALKNTVEHPWVTGAEKQALLHEYSHPLSAPVAGDPQAEAQALVHGMAQATKTSFEHPLRNPDQTLLNVMALLGGAAGAAGKAGLIDVSAPRLFDLGDQGGQVSLKASHSALMRTAQKIHDVVVKRALEQNPEGTIASYGRKRLGGAIAETNRMQSAMRAVPAQLLQVKGRKIDLAEQAALRLAAENSTPEEAAAFHLAQAEKGIAPEANAELAHVYETVSSRGLLHQDAAGNVVVNADAHPTLAALDQLLAKGSAEREAILSESGQMSPEGLQARLDLPGQIRRAGAPGPEPLLAQRALTQTQAQAQLVDLDARYQALLEKIVPEVSPYGGNLSRAEQLRRNFENSRAGHGNRIGASRIGTVKAEELALAEDKLHELIAKYPDNPALQPVASLITERQQLRDLLNARAEAGIAGERPPSLPATGEPRLVGFEGDRARSIFGPEGRSYVSYRQLEQKASQRPYASASSPVVGRVRNFVSKSKRFEGQTLEHGQVPPNTTGLVASDLRKAYRFANTLAFRSKLYKLGSATKQTSRDVLVNTQALGEHALTNADVQRAAGQLRNVAKSTGVDVGTKARVIAQEALRLASENTTPEELLARGLADVNPEWASILRDLQKLGVVTRDASGRAVIADKFPELQVAARKTASKPLPEGLRAQLNGATLTSEDTPHDTATTLQAFEQWRQGLLHHETLGEGKGLGRGAPAPEGWRWVPQELLGELSAPVVPKTAVGRFADNVNSAVTAATVYYKVGHIATRVLTNAAANLIQGSLRPFELAKGVQLWRALSDTDKLRAIAAAGEGGLHALPHEGASLIARGAARGASWWSRHADVPFRFNSLAYEARRVGIETPEQFTTMLDLLQHPESLPADVAAGLEDISRRANREAIAYDRLNPFEKRFLTRAVWFYPWVQGSTRFLMNTLTEHPAKSAAIGQIGAQGRRTQEAQLGELPSFAAGLFKVGGSQGMPTVEDLSTISPFATPADVLQTFGGLLGGHPTDAQTLSGYLNPALSALGAAAYHLNPYGGASKNSMLEDALTGLLSPTPEYGTVQEILTAHGDQSKRMYPRSVEHAIAKLLLGSGVPRTMNEAVANDQARKELQAAGAIPSSGKSKKTGNIFDR
jgi:hypothetical protein